MWIVAAVIAALYIASMNPRAGAPRTTTARATSAAPPGGTFFATIGGAIKQIAIPGVGSYTDVGNGQSQISLSPGLWSTIFGAGAAQPNAVTAVPSPVDLGYLPTAQLPADVGTFYL